MRTQLHLADNLGSTAQHSTAQHWAPVRLASLMSSGAAVGDELMAADAAAIRKFFARFNKDGLVDVAAAIGIELTDSETTLQKGKLLDYVTSTFVRRCNQSTVCCVLLDRRRALHVLRSCTYSLSVSCIFFRYSPPPSSPLLSIDVRGCSLPFFFPLVCVLSSMRTCRVNRCKRNGKCEFPFHKGGGIKFSQLAIADIYCTCISPRCLAVSANARSLGCSALCRKCCGAPLSIPSVVLHFVFSVTTVVLSRQSRVLSCQLTVFPCSLLLPPSLPPSPPRSLALQFNLSRSRPIIIHAVFRSSNACQQEVASGESAA